MNIKRIKELHSKGVVTYAGLQRAKIIVRFEEIKSKYKTLNEVYFILSEEFHLSEFRIRNIISVYRKKG